MSCFQNGGALYIFMHTQARQPFVCLHSAAARSGTQSMCPQHNTATAEQGSWVSAVSERQRFDHRQRQTTFPQVSASKPALGPTELRLKWVPGVLSLVVKGGRSGTLTTHFQQVRRLRMHGAVLPLPCTSPWSGAQLSTSNNFTFTPTAVSK
jgi:hypothetical protein